MKKFLQVLLHILGFPLLLAAVVLVSLPLLECGISYGVFIFVGIIVTVVMALVYYITFIIMVKSKKKSITRQTITLIVVVFICLCGFWCVFDLAIPDFLAGATSHTIFYEDLVDNYEARALVNQSLLDEYIKRNYAIGNLPMDKSLEDYQYEGFRNEYVKRLLQSQFASIDQDGYTTFVQPWIGMANDGRLTIPALIHLLTDDRNLKEVNYIEFDQELKDLKETDPLKWNVLDMLGTDMDLAVDLGSLNPALPFLLSGLLPTDKMIEESPTHSSGIRYPVAAIVESLLGSPIYVKYDGATITLTPSNESRGVLDYQSMAWLNSNGLVYAIVSLLATRNLFLIFAGWIVLSNFLIGVLRGMGKENKGRAGKVDVDFGAPAETEQPVNNFMPMPYPYGYVVNSVGYNITPNHAPMQPAYGMNMGRPMYNNNMNGQRQQQGSNNGQRGNAQQRQQRPQGGSGKPNNGGRKR